MVVEPALKVALAVRVALTMDGLDGDVAQLAAEAAPGGNPIANVPALRASGKRTKRTTLRSASLPSIIPQHGGVYLIQYLGSSSRLI